MTKLQHNSALAGYLMGGSLAVIRVAGASNLRDLLIAGALTATEFSVVGLLARKAKGLEAEVNTWHATEQIRSRQERALKGVEEEHAHSQQLLAATVEESKGLEYEIMLDHLMSDLKALVAIAVNAVRCGYHTGISDNGGEMGRVKGGKAA